MRDSPLYFVFTPMKGWFKAVTLCAVKRCLISSWQVLFFPLPEINAYVFMARQQKRCLKAGETVSGAIKNCFDTPARV